MSSSFRWRARYGAGPMHLALLVASFAIAGAAVVGWLQRRSDFTAILEWFGAAILIHDLVLLPAYSLVDRVVFGRGSAGASTHQTPAPAASRYVRIPAMLSGLLLLVFLPSILGFGARGAAFASGISEHGYALRWLIATAVLFASSGLAYGVAGARRRIRRRAAARSRTRPSQPRIPPVR